MIGTIFGRKQYEDLMVLMTDFCWAGECTSLLAGRGAYSQVNRKDRIAPLFTSKHFPRPPPATATSGHNRLDFEEVGKVL